MKLKNLFVLIPILFFVFLIYNINKDTKIYYVNLGDNMLADISYADFLNKQLGDRLEFYNNDFTNVKYQTTDLINEINNNYKVNNKTIKNAVIRADIVTLSIGNNELNRKELTKEYIDELINDIDLLLSLLRTWCKEKIIVIGLNNEYASYELAKLAKKYEMEYIDVFKYSDLYKDGDKINLLGQTFISQHIVDNL